MIKDKINKNFDKYKKWFKTLLMKEFFNLPLEKQKEFITLVKEFLNNCEKIHEEAKNIKEKIFEIQIKDITHNTEGFTITGSIEGNDIKIDFPLSELTPKKGNSVTCILYSIDEQEWYSSKTKLIEETR